MHSPAFGLTSLSLVVSLARALAGKYFIYGESGDRRNLVYSMEEGNLTEDSIFPSPPSSQ